MDSLETKKMKAKNNENFDLSDETALKHLVGISKEG